MSKGMLHLVQVGDVEVSSQMGHLQAPQGSQPMGPIHQHLGSRLHSIIRARASVKVHSSRSGSRAWQITEVLWMKGWRQ